MSYTETIMEYVYDQYCLSYNMEETLDFLEDEIDFTREEIKDKTLFNSGHIPKVVFRNDGRLLYQSRAGIPTTKKKEFIKSWRQVCLYSIPYEKLIEFAKHKKTLLERLEDCELNRFLELGFEVKMIRMSDKSISIDTLNNLKVLNRILKKNEL